MSPVTTRVPGSLPGTTLPASSIGTSGGSTLYWVVVGSTVLSLPSLLASK